MEPQDDEESVDEKREKLDEMVKTIFDEMVRDGTYAMLTKERDRRPGSTIKVKATRDGGLKFYVDDPNGPTIGEIALRFVVSVTLGVVACGAFGWLASKMYQWIQGPQPDIDILFLYRGVLCGSLVGLLACFQPDDDEIAWSQLPRSKKVISSLMGTTLLIGVLAAGWRLKDLAGTISIFGIFATHYFSSSKPS